MQRVIIAWRVRRRNRSSFKNKDLQWDKSHSYFSLQKIVETYENEQWGRRIRIAGRGRWRWCWWNPWFLPYWGWWKYEWRFPLCCKEKLDYWWVEKEKSYYGKEWKKETKIGSRGRRWWKHAKECFSFKFKKVTWNIS